MRKTRMYIAAIIAAAGCLLVPLTTITITTTPLHAQEARGTIQGRIYNPASKEYVRDEFHVHAAALQELARV